MKSALIAVSCLVLGCSVPAQAQEPSGSIDLDLMAASGRSELMAGEPAVAAQNGLASFWPRASPSMRWDLVSRSAKSNPNAEILMSVINETLSSDRFMLWFFNKKGQKPGERDGEMYRVCEMPQRVWMYLDGYVKHKDNGSADHPVKVDRALLIFDGKKPIDLIADGEHKACGETGQPYLIWSPTDRNYRIQGWGHLVENAKWRWYWDAQVTLGETIENDCLSPGKQTPTVKVQEAWWNNFKVPAGEWALGKGEMNDANGWPTGRSVAFGRTVWHGDGKIPYFMTGDATSRPTWCAKRIVANPNGDGN